MKPENALRGSWSRKDLVSFFASECDFFGRDDLNPRLIAEGYLRYWVRTSRVVRLRRGLYCWDPNVVGVR